MGEKEYILAARLFEEINRLENEDKRFRNNEIAIEALEAVKFWAIEETV